MANFTPQEIEEMLQEFFDVVGKRQYVGARYVPVFGRKGEDTIEWDNLAPYEPLTVVMHQGISYVSKQYVPVGIEITDTAFWAETYRFNAQVEQYRQEVLQFQSQIDQIREDMESDYVPFPDSATYPKYGVLGQVLTTLSNGETKWENPVVPSDEQAEEVITAWLTAHPEATTTVQDNSLNFLKFIEQLRNTIVMGNVANRNDELTESYDLNTLTKNGFFWYASNHLPQNTPTAETSFMWSFSTPNNGKMQFVITDSRALYWRWYRTSWTTWQRVMLGSSAEYNDDAAYEILPSGTDYLTLGIGDYRCTTGALAQTMVNCPTTASHKLRVFKLGNGSDIFREVYANEGRPSIYVQCNSSAWVDISNVGLYLRYYPTTVTSSNWQTVLPDFDDAANNTIYNILRDCPIPHRPKGARTVSKPSDLDTGKPLGTLVTFGTTAGTPIKTQIFTYAAPDPILGAQPYNSIICIRQKIAADTWTDWSYMGDSMTMRSGNMFITEALIQSGDADFDDFDDAPGNTVYHVDLDAVSMANNPLSGHSCIVTTYAGSISTKHGRYQTCVGVNNDEPEFYFRYGFQQTSTTFVWTGWKHLQGVMV